jgi:D-alanine-D-alanine ligase
VIFYLYIVKDLGSLQNSIETSRREGRRVVILAGGWSGEREVSLSSGKGVYNALTTSGRYSDVIMIDVTKDILKLVQNIENAKPDVIFNALHGIGGEDGVIQGVLEMLKIPYTHSGVTASAIAMDKVLSRIIFAHYDVPVPTWEVCTIECLAKKEHSIPFPLVIKPRNEGSSIGVYIVKSENELNETLKKLNYGPEVLVEAYISGKEIQTAVLNGKALGTIEIKPHSEFFDYTAKYTEGAADHIMPASIPSKDYAKVSALSEVAYNSIGCRGVARLDFIYSDSGVPYLLELNSQPGLTDVSLVPDIAKYYGMSYLDVIEEMIEVAFGLYKSSQTNPQKESIKVDTERRNGVQMY